MSRRRLGPWRAVHSLREEWRRNYRFRGGLAGLGAGLWGAARWQLARRRPIAEDAGLEVVTFSVLPALTRLWATTLLPLLGPGDRLLIGDGSGGLRGGSAEPRVRVLPVYNHVHGVKLDLFMERVCRAPLVLVADDDIFWLGAEPLEWARQKLAERPRLAVVSLYPRGAPKPVLAGRVEQPMGSFCLLIRRRSWLEEGLSFRCRDTTGQGDYHWTYDTADEAHVELLRRGFEVAIAPPELRAGLAPLEGVSGWGLKLQKHGGDMALLLQTRLRLCKAYRVFYFLEQARPLTARYTFGSSSDIVPAAFLERGLAWCRTHLDSEGLRSIEAEVAALLSRLERRLEGCPCSIL